MNILQKFRLPFHLKALQKILQHLRRKRITHNLWSARSIQIWFDAEKKEDVEALQALATALEKEGKKVQLIGYLHQCKENKNPGFACFTRKSVNFWGKLTDTAAQQASQAHVDLLMVFNPKQHWMLELTTAASPAHMKIGSFSPRPIDLDLMFEMPDNASAAQFLQQLDIYLDKIIVSDESVFA